MPEQIAKRLGARPVGPGKWMARCPAHDDHQPSLSIRSGRGDRTLIHCFAGCTLNAVLQAAKLGVRDLFSECAIPVTSCTLPEDSGSRESRCVFRQADKASRDKCRKLEAICDALAAKLARLADDAPESDAITRLYHETLTRLRSTEASLDAKK
jgi:hypothetical protein